MATRKPARQAARRRSRRISRAQCDPRKILYGRTLRYEPLEDRRLLALVTVDTPLDTVDPDDDFTSLREAIFATNLVSDPDEITFDFGHDGPETIVLTQGELRITDQLTINGPGAELLTIDASGSDPTPDQDNGDGARIFNIDGSMVLTVSIAGLTLTGGDVATSGGAILSHENFTLSNSVITGNSTGGDGGGILSRGNLVVDRTTISHNSAIHGGGLSANRLTASNSKITGNSATRNGGAINSDRSLALDNTAISGNTARYGAGIFSAGALAITACTINGNVAELGGGGIISHGSMNVADSTISHNSAAVHSGGVWTSGNVTLTGSTMTGNSTGGSGGAIHARDDVSLANSTISGNSAGDSGGAIYGSRVTLSNSTISDNSAGSRGGGFVARSSFTATNSVITGNSAQFGGGVYANTATVTVTQSTISGNSAGRSGGGILAGTTTVTNSTVSGNSAASGAGGGISMRGGTIASSTISGNSAVVGGGISSSQGYSSSVSTSVKHSTIAFNTAGIGGGAYIASGTLALNHTILATNSANTGSDIHGPMGASATARYSLIGVGGALFAPAPIGSPDANGNLIGGNPSDAINPRLALLADNGGPTKTHALFADSPAINAGDLNAKAGEGGVLLYDQRGEPFGRVVNGRIDIGAFEYQEPSDLNLVVDTLDDESDGDHGRGDLSLREAIELANLYPSDDTIRFDPALTAAGPSTILLTQGELRITDHLTITGSGAELLTIDASGNDPTPDTNNGDGSRIFNINKGSGVLIDVSIADLTLTGGDTATDGGAVLSIGRVTIFDSVITGNSSVRNGGGIFGRGDLVVEGTTISHNSGRFGGGLYGSTRTLTLTACTIVNNLAEFRGGGIYTSRAMTVVDSTISHNSAVAGIGGGIHAAAGITITGSAVSHNSSGFGGGGIRMDSGDATITDSTMIGNSAGGSGGGIFAWEAVTLTNSTITGNSAGESGGAVDARWVTLLNSVISGNTAEYSGGGVHANSSFMATDSVVAGNSAQFGGGVYTNAATVIRCTISDNLATGFGGGGIRAGSVTVTNSTISGNSATGGMGGGIRMHGGTIANSTISGNSAVVGGGIYSAATSGSPRVDHSTIALNTATMGGGAFIASGTITLNHTFLAANRAITGLDIHGLIGTSATARYSLIGVGSPLFTPAPIGSPDANGNLIGGNSGSGQEIRPRVAPLTDNGGPTNTHALFADSLALNAGDPAAVPGVGGVPQFDQRGAPFTRVHGGRIDIGAFESQPNPLTGDYNFNGVVDTADVVIWRKTRNRSGDLRADGNGDGVVNDDDWQVWRANYGRTAGSEEQGARSVEQEAVAALPQRPAWQPPASPGVSVATSRGAFRPATQRFAADDDLLASVAMPLARGQGRNEFIPARRQLTRDTLAAASYASVGVIDRVFEPLGADLAGSRPSEARRLFAQM